MANPNGRLTEILGSVDQEGVRQLSRRQRDALEIVHCAAIIDGMIGIDDDYSRDGIGLISFRGMDYVVDPKDATEWGRQLERLAVVSGFEDGVQGAVIVAAAICPQP